MVTSYERSRPCLRLGFHTLFLWTLLLFSGFLALAIDTTISIYILITCAITMILFVAIMLIRLYILFHCLKPRTSKPSISLAQVPPMVIINPDNTYHVGIPMYMNLQNLQNSQNQPNKQIEIPMYVAHIEAV